MANTCVPFSLPYIALPSVHATAEALAINKWLVCARHPCNEFFSTFANCLIYDMPDEFVEKLDYALTHPPAPLTVCGHNCLPAILRS